MIYFIRHGATDWNENINDNGEKDPRCQGRADLPLNSNGIKQAYLAARQLEGKEFKRVLCSPLTRAKQTCEIIYHGDTLVEYDDRLLERDFGELEGYCKSQFDFYDFWNVYSKKTYKRAESIKDLEKRVFDLLDELHEDPTGDILIVSHGGVGSALMSYFEGIPNNGDYLSFPMPNAKPLKIEFKKNIYKR